ncbi:MAG: TrkA C-terminal domain-containing protein, partial [Streptosporangiaceae bacterium]
VQTAQAQLAAEWALPDPESALRDPPTPLRGYQILEVTIEASSPAAGRALRTITWPPGANVVSVLHNRRIRDPDPALTLHPGDRIILLTRRPHDQPPGQAPGSGAAGRTADSPAPAHGQSNADRQ